MMTTIAPSEPARPLDWCDRCSAAWVRCTDAGELLCWYHWLADRAAAWASGAPDSWTAGEVLETMGRAPRPLTAPALLELVGYHPLRRLPPGERERFEQDLTVRLAESLVYLTAAGVLVAIAGGRYVWSAAAKELLPPTCVGEPGQETHAGVNERGGEAFSRWLGRQHQRKDAIGDLANDMRRDESWPKRVRRLDTLRCYLHSRDACEGALAALEAAYREWDGGA